MANQPAGGPLSNPDVWNEVAEGYVEEIVPVFERYAQDALRLGKLKPGTEVLDVASGPGTLTLLAAEVAERVVALDFATKMLDELRLRAAAAGLGNIDVLHGDGQALPFEDRRFDAAFSMFGLIFFPDRARGFSELYRVLRPGGRAVVSSWTPTNNVPVLGVLFDALAEHLPDIPLRDGHTPLGDEESFRAEMEGAGFQPVQIHRVMHVTPVPNVEIFWHANVRSAAPLVALRHAIGEQQWVEVGRGVLARLVAQFGTAPVEIPWSALLGVGVR